VLTRRYLEHHGLLRSQVPNIDPIYLDWEGNAKIQRGGSSPEEPDGRRIHILTVVVRGRMGPESASAPSSDLPSSAGQTRSIASD
jgi:hypothetical protein